MSKATAKVLMLEFTECYTGCINSLGYLIFYVLIDFQKARKGENIERLNDDLECSLVFHNFIKQEYKIKEI